MPQDDILDEFDSGHVRSRLRSKKLVYLGPCGATTKKHQRHCYRRGVAKHEGKVYCSRHIGPARQGEKP